MSPWVSESDTAPRVPPPSPAKPHRPDPRGPSSLLTPHTHGDVDSLKHPFGGHRATASEHLWEAEARVRMGAACPDVGISRSTVLWGAGQAGKTRTRQTSRSILSINQHDCSSVNHISRPRYREATGTAGLRICSLSLETVTPLSSSPSSFLPRDATHSPGTGGTPIMTWGFRAFHENQQTLFQPNREPGPRTEGARGDSPGKSFISFLEEKSNILRSDAGGGFGGKGPVAQPRGPARVSGPVEPPHTPRPPLPDRPSSLALMQTASSMLIRTAPSTQEAA